MAFFYDQAGLLFLATVNGTDNGSGTLMSIYLYGTGTNGVDGEVDTLNNAAGGYYVNSFSASGTDLSTSYSTSGLTSSYLVSDILAGISAAMVLKGYTQVSLVGNKLVMSLSTGFVLTSVGFKTFPELDSDNTRFANVWDSGYQYAIQYFDAQGRTIGAQTSVGAAINTPSNNLASPFPIITLSILNRPPLYATYYQVLRSNNTTYNKRLCWVSESAYTGIAADESDIRFFYIGIGNIAAYNESISSTQNVVSYNYTEGDRIKFLRRYDVLNEPVAIPSQFDYEIVGTVTSFEYNLTLPAPVIPDYNTYTATGTFLKIRYPDADISTDFRFPGTPDYQHYEILLYNYSTNADVNQRFYYEFGKAYGIGNPGTSNRYHFGMTQLADGGATIPVTNGDLFYRLRNVPNSDLYKYASSAFDISTSGAYASGSETFPITVDNTIDNISYKIQTQPGAVADLSGGGFPVWASTGFFFYNKSASYEKTISINGSFNVSSDGGSTLSVYAIVCTNTPSKYTVSLLPIEVNDIIQNTPTTFTINKKFSVPATGKVWIVAESTNDDTGSNKIVIQPMTFDFQVVKTTTIGIIESSFSDTYNLVTNSNGRPSVVDENARQTYYPTLIRFGQAYQSNTNINATNRFFFENFDEYDRSFGDVMRLHVRDRYLKVYQKFKVGNVPILTQIVKDVSGNPLQANTDQLINKIQYYAGDYGIGDASTSLAWNNFADYFVDDYRGVVCRLGQDGITPISITNSMNSFFVAKLKAYRTSLNNGYGASGTTSDYTGNPCIYGAFDAYTNKYIIALEEINRYSPATTTTTTSTSSTTTTTTIGPTTTTTSSTTTTTSAPTTTTTTIFEPVTTVIPGFVSLLDDGGDAACAGGDFSNVNITVYGTTICNATLIIGLSSTLYGNVFAEMDPNEVFFVSDGENSREFTRNGTTLTATPTFGCVSCPTSTTTTTTTIAPTTTTTTIAPDTTTTTTTAAPTTTTTTTEAPIPECVQYVVLDVTESGAVDFLDCFGSSRQASVGTGVQTLDYSTDGCIQSNSLSGTAMFTITEYGPECNPGTTTTTTTAAPTTTTTTVATTTTTTQATAIVAGYVSLLDGESACTGGEYASVNITVVGSTICNATSIIGLSSTPFGNVFADMDPDQVFYVSDGTNSRQFTRNGTSTTANQTGACVACPTTTTTTTTTTTAAPTTTTTTVAPTTYSVELCGGGEGPFIVTLASGDTPSGIGQSYKLSKATTPFDGIKCWEVLEVNPAGSIDYANVAFGTVFSNCLACSPTTTTTSTTSTTTSTTSTTTSTSTTTTTLAPVYYNIFDCSNSSTGYSIAYTPGTFASNERCTAAASGFPTRTVIIIGSTTTLPGGTLYTLTSQGVFGCAATTTTTTAAPTTTTTTSTTTTTTAAPTTTTTTEAPPNSYEYAATRCATGNPVTIYYSTNDLSIGQTYYVPGTAPTECFTIDNYNGPSTNSPTYSFGGFAIDCFDEARCVQA